MRFLIVAEPTVKGGELSAAAEDFLARLAKDAFENDDSVRYVGDPAVQVVLDRVRDEMTGGTLEVLLHANRSTMRRGSADESHEYADLDEVRTDGFQDCEVAIFLGGVSNDADPLASDLMQALEAFIDNSGGEMAVLAGFGGEAAREHFTRRAAGSDALIITTEDPERALTETIDHLTEED